MKLKTIEKLRRRFERLPLHHIDTSVILGSEDDEEERIRKRYIQKVGYNYKGRLSLPVLSELFIKFLSLETMEEKDVFVQIMNHFKNKRRIDLYFPQKIWTLMEEIHNIDNRLEPTDIQIIACAIEDQAFTLITLDKNLIGHKSIKEKYNLNITHPKDFT